MEDVRRLITVELFTDTFRYVGEIVIIGVGHNKRLTDYLNSSQPFIPLLNPKLYTVNGELIREEEVVIVNKNAIKFVFPLEESQENFQEKSKKYIDSEKYFKEFGGGSEPTQTKRVARPSPGGATSSFQKRPPNPPRNLSESNPFLKKPTESQVNSNTSKYKAPE